LEKLDQLESKIDTSTDEKVGRIEKMLKDFKYNILDSHLSVEGLIGPGG